jgi:hypothetical protein
MTAKMMLRRPLGALFVLGLISGCVQEPVSTSGDSAALGSSSAGSTGAECSSSNAEANAAWAMAAKIFVPAPIACGDLVAGGVSRSKCDASGKGVTQIQVSCAALGFENMKKYSVCRPAVEALSAAAASSAAAECQPSDGISPVDGTPPVEDPYVDLEAGLPGDNVHVLQTKDSSMAEAYSGDTSAFASHSTDGKTTVNETKMFTTTTKDGVTSVTWK